MSNRKFAAGNQSHKPHRLTRGLGDLPEIPATGQRFSLVCGSIILELESGKIRRESDYWDAATFMKQVGVLPLQMSDVFPTHLYHSHLYYMYTQAVRLGPWVNREVGPASGACAIALPASAPARIVAENSVRSIFSPS